MEYIFICNMSTDLQYLQIALQRTAMNLSSSLYDGKSCLKVEQIKNSRGQYCSVEIKNSYRIYSRGPDVNTKHRKPSFQKKMCKQKQIYIVPTLQKCWHQLL